MLILKTTIMIKMVVQGQILAHVVHILAQLYYFYPAIKSISSTVPALYYMTHHKSFSQLPPLSSIHNFPLLIHLSISSYSPFTHHAHRPSFNHQAHDLK